MLAEMFLRTMQRYKKILKYTNLFPKKVRNILRQNIKHRFLKGGDEGRDQGGDVFSEVPINRDFMRVDGRDNSFFQNYSLFLKSGA